jgi:hypothetical protein
MEYGCPGKMVCYLGIWRKEDWRFCTFNARFRPNIGWKIVKESYIFCKILRFPAISKFSNLILFTLI